MNTKASLTKAFDLVGKTPLAKLLGISYQAMNLWQLKEKLPRTEYSGETAYAKAIQDATDGKVTVEDLLGSTPSHQA
ncbi:MAG: regulator [Gammaproteobacteria bacterium]